MSRLSVVLPAYNEELMVAKTCRVLREVLSGAGISYELVLVDDGSKDRTWDEITKAGERDEMFLVFIFPEILEKKLQYMQGWHRQLEMWWQLWTVICSTHQKLFCPCMSCGSKVLK